MRTLLTLWLAASLFGCDSETPPEATTETETPAVETAPGERETIEAPVAEGAAEGLEEVGEALGDAIRAGVGAEGRTHCETAYNGAIAMVEQMRLETGQDGEGEVPDRAAFLEACQQLPPDAQQCMVMSYALEHQQECATWRNDPRVLAMQREMRLAAE